MFGRQKQVSAQKIPVHSVVGPDMRLNGVCEFQGGLQIEGQVFGPVSGVAGVPSSLRIEAGGQVQGEVSADHVLIGGTVIGPVSAREHLELLPTARIEGDVRYKSLDMRPGAIVAGLLQPQLVPLPQDEASVAEPPLDKVQPDLTERQEPGLDEPAFEAEPADAAHGPREPVFELQPDKTD